MYTQEKEQLLNMMKADNDFISVVPNANNFEKIAKDWLSDINLCDFLLDKEYLDISWYRINSKLYDGDSLWEDFVDYVKTNSSQNFINNVLFSYMQ